MNLLSFRLRPLVFSLTLFMCLASAMGVWAAESSGETSIKPEIKEQYRQEILGNKEEMRVEKEYVIGFRDILYVEVYGEGSMAVGPANPAGGGVDFSMKSAEEGQDTVRGRGTGAEVMPDGRVSLRHLGDVYIVGMTLAQGAEYLKKLYGTVFNNPTVVVSLVQSNSRQYTMMGQVKAPGLYHLDYPLTVVKAIAKTGGFTEWANSRVTVIRQVNEKAAGAGQEAGGGSVRQFTFDYDDFLKGKNVEKNIVLEPGDVVVAH